MTLLMGSAKAKGQMDFGKRGSYIQNGSYHITLKTYAHTYELKTYEYLI